MIVVSDTSVITALLQIGRAELLVSLYREVVIPGAVERELRRAHHVLPQFLRVAQVHDRSAVERLSGELDLGEAEAIVLVKEGRGDLLLIDERKGRRVAQREGVPHIGLLAVLFEAKQAGLVIALSPVLESLEQIAGFRVSPTLKARVLAEAGEAPPRG